MLTYNNGLYIIALQNLIKATKNQAPNGFPVFADL